MTPTTIKDKVRRLYQVNSSQYTDADILIDLNDLKNDFQRALINAVEEDWNWDTWWDDTIALQGEYEIPEVSSTAIGAKQIKQVSINYDGSTFENTGKLQYTPCKLVNPDTLDFEWNYYEENQSQDNPLYFVADNHIFIAPVPKNGESGIERLKLKGIRNIADYTYSSTEADMQFPTDVQNLFVQGLEPFAMRTKGMPRNEVNAAIAEYNRLQMEKISQMTNRVETAMIMEYPNELDSNEL